MVVPAPSSDLVLLAVGPRAGWTGRGPIGTAVAGAQLAEHVLSGGSLPRAGERTGARRRHLAQDVAGWGPSALAGVAGSLCAAGVLEPAEHKVLGVFPRRGFAVASPAAVEDARGRLVAGLVPGAVPGPGGALLVTLAAVSGVARAWSPPPVRRDDRRALAAHLNGLLAQLPADVGEVVLAVRTAYRRSGAGDGGGDLGSDGYGDSGGDGGGGGGDGGGGDGGGGGGGD